MCIALPGSEKITCLKNFGHVTNFLMGIRKFQDFYSLSSFNRILYGV